MTSALLGRADAMRLPVADGSVQCIVTSPPYLGLRDYGLAGWVGGDADCEHALAADNGTHRKARAPRLSGHDAKDRCRCGAVAIGLGIGLEPTLDEYIEDMRAVGREMWRVLRDDGTLWLNLGDCYGAGGGKQVVQTKNASHGLDGMRQKTPGLASKQLAGLPWRVAFAFQADGWYLRSDIIWSKPNGMPESVRDRPTRSHEYLFLLTKSAKYHYDAEAIAEPDAGHDHARRVLKGQASLEPSGDLRSPHRGIRTESGRNGLGRNRRTVWTIPTQPYRGAHFATFPEKLVEPCILAGTSPKACGVCGAPWEREIETEGGRDWHSDKMLDAGLPGQIIGENGRKRGRSASPLNNTKSRQTVGWRPTCGHNDDTGSCLVLDPFCGSGTVGAVSRRLGRRFVGIDLSSKYLELARERIFAVPEGMPL